MGDFWPARWDEVQHLLLLGTKYHELGQVWDAEGFTWLQDFIRTKLVQDGGAEPLVIDHGIVVMGGSRAKSCL